MTTNIGYEFPDNSGEIESLRQQLAECQSEYGQIRGMLIDVIKDMPRLSCEDFHHKKKDQHKDYTCPVAERFYFRFNKLLSFFGIEELE